MGALFAALSGLLFGVGLVLAGMTNPARIKAFLDLAGAWDLSLLLVMAAAVAVAAPAFVLAQRRTRAWSGAAIDLALPRHIDGRLVAGAALFGIGWGLAGFCPGPAWVALTLGGEAGQAALVFVPAMLAGMVLHDRLMG